MAGFTYCCRRILDPRKPLPVRYVMFIEACSAFRGLCGRPVTFQNVHDVLGAAIGFSRDHKPSSEQLVLAASALIAARFQLLHLLREYERARHRRKAAGNRAKPPRAFTPEEALNLLRKASADGSVGS